MTHPKDEATIDFVDASHEVLNAYVWDQINPITRKQKPLYEYIAKGLEKASQAGRASRELKLPKPSEFFIIVNDIQDSYTRANDRYSVFDKWLKEQIKALNDESGER